MHQRKLNLLDMVKLPSTPFIKPPWYDSLKAVSARIEAALPPPLKYDAWVECNWFIPINDRDASVTGFIVLFFLNVYHLPDDPATKIAVYDMDTLSRRVIKLTPLEAAINAIQLSTQKIVDDCISDASNYKERAEAIENVKNVLQENDAYNDAIDTYFREILYLCRVNDLPYNVMYGDKNIADVRKAFFFHMFETFAADLVDIHGLYQAA
jgi:hypothetical protein